MWCHALCFEDAEVGSRGGEAGKRGRGSLLHMRSAR